MTAAMPRMTATDDELRAALSGANIPTLLLVLAHLTGDRAWLADPYRPSRTVALNDNDTGGFSDERQQEIRDAAFGVLRDWRDGRTRLAPDPTDDEIVDMLAVSLGEQIPPEYATALAEEGGFRDRDVHWTNGAAPAAAQDFRVVVIGAGVAGLCAAIKLRELGIPFTVIERNDRVGGVWLENTYPGAGVDTPSHLYSYSFAPNPHWSRYFSKQPEIVGYLDDCARRFGVLPHVRFGTEVAAAHYDPSTSTWQVHVRPVGGDRDAPGDGPTELLVADVVISSVGQLNRPHVPNIPGLDSFDGPAFHSARWRHDVDITGKRVAVVGTGASAMQIVPEIAGTAGSVTVFQRSPQWAAPNGNYLRHVQGDVGLLVEQVPYYATWYRLRLMWMYQDKLHPTLQKDPDWPHPERAVNAINDKHRVFLSDHIREQIAGREDELLDKVLPDYPPYGKRMLIDNGWFSAIQRDDVELVDEGVAAIEGSDIVTSDGTRRPADVLVLATGFQSRRMLWPMDVHGRSGTSLRELWGDDDARAYLGMTVPDFPNFFVLYGPNTNLGHGGSIIFHAECQVRYVTAMIRDMVEKGISAVEVRPEVCDAYNDRVDAAHANMIWTHPGMDTWYRNAEGRIVTNTPWRLIDYWAMTHEPDLDEFVVTSSEPAAAR
jgi:4-hydroxyacetophenone monooxygenase